MELKIGDLVKHNVHGWYGIVLTNVGRWGTTNVCRVEWVQTGRRHLIDTGYLINFSRSNI
tara:strand:- start:81 stop:260 length:180 start_codon:yes stop_codon:yes gene_type:complete